MHLSFYWPFHVFFLWSRASSCLAITFHTLWQRRGFVFSKKVSFMTARQLKEHSDLWNISSFFPEKNMGENKFWLTFFMMGEKVICHSNISGQCLLLYVPRRYEGYKTFLRPYEERKDSNFFIVNRVFNVRKQIREIESLMRSFRRKIQFRWFLLQTYGRFRCGSPFATFIWLIEYWKRCGVEVLLPEKRFHTIFEMEAMLEAL